MDIDHPEPEFSTMFTTPFEPKKIIYSLSSDFFRDGNLACKIREKQLVIDVDDEELLHNPLPQFPCGENGCRQCFNTVFDYEIHYRIAHTIVCSECKKTLPSYNLLDLHIQEKHESQFGSKEQGGRVTFRCLVEGCVDSFFNWEERNEHVIQVHKYPANFKFPLIKSGRKQEKMEISPSDDVLAKCAFTSKPRNLVPRDICFGRGSSRCFLQKKKVKSHCVPKDFTMKEVSKALSDSGL